MFEQYFRNCVLSLLFVLVPVTAQSAGLPPEHEAARLMLAVEDSVEKSEWESARNELDQLTQLQVSYPQDYFYFDGRVDLELGDSASAQESLEQYIVKAGKEGRYYKDALMLITRIVDKKAQESSNGVPQTEAVPEIKSESDGYISSLKALFLTQDAKTALVQHANSLLAAHPYSGKRMKKAMGREGIHYSVALAGTELLVQRKSFEDEQPLLTVDKLNVLGVDPFLEYACSAQELVCWIYHPSQENERWILLDRDELVAQELNRALSKLIRLMQAG